MGRDFRAPSGLRLNFLSFPRTFFNSPTGDSMYSPIASTTQDRGSSAGTHAALTCNTQIHSRDELRPPAKPQPEFTPAPPVVAGTLLSGEQLSFLEFLHDSATADYCALLLGSNGTAAAKMLQELRNATEFHYFGYWHSSRRDKNPAPGSGKLTASAAATKKLLKKYARRAYRGDTERRGVNYWERVAWLVWNSYAMLMALRRRAETIKQQEQRRLASLPAKRAARNKYMRVYRAKKRDKQRAKAAHYTTNEAKEAWRQQRSQNRKGENQ
jgi:hypothetical protein